MEELMKRLNRLPVVELMALHDGLLSCKFNKVFRKVIGDGTLSYDEGVITLEDGTIVSIAVLENVIQNMLISVGMNGKEENDNKEKKENHGVCDMINLLKVLNLGKQDLLNIKEFMEQNKHLPRAIQYYINAIRTPNGVSFDLEANDKGYTVYSIGKPSFTITMDELKQSIESLIKNTNCEQKPKETRDMSDIDEAKIISCETADMLKDVYLAMQLFRQLDKNELLYLINIFDSFSHVPVALIKFQLYQLLRSKNILPTIIICRDNIMINTNHPISVSVQSLIMVLKYLYNKSSVSKDENKYEDAINILYSIQQQDVEISEDAYDKLQTIICNNISKETLVKLVSERLN